MAFDNNQPAAKRIYDIRDLSDFCVNWPNFEDFVSDTDLKNSDLPPASQLTIGWLRELAQRVCVLPEADLPRHPE